jgi:RNA polymerase sigma factor (sigma-70 family)
MNAREQILDVIAKLDALLRLRYAAGEQDQARDAIVTRYLVNELRRWRPQLKLTASLEEAIAASAELSLDDVAVLRRRCLFYGCDALISLLVNKRIKGDAIAREEAVLYVQDRLQRDDFRRIDSFQLDRGASFVTYMWQVINNLLLDFLRAHSKRAQQERDDMEIDAELQADEADAGAFVDESGRSQTSAERGVEAMQLRALLAETMSERAVDGAHPLRSRLREHLNLTSQERVLLKAMFQYDMSIAEICALPGFDLSAGEAYRSYYRVMERLMEAFKQAGLTEALRSLVSNAAPRVAVTIGDEAVQLAANRIYYLLQEKRGTACHVRWRGDPQAGLIGESFAKLLKRLSAYFSAIDSRTALSDSVLTASYRQWYESGEVIIAGIERKFSIGARFLIDLRSRFDRTRTEKRAGSLV